MTVYEEVIIEATGCSLSEAREIEEIMRGVVYRSTLDWQTRQELIDGARLAQAVLHYERTEGDADS